jgi:hypothetical protein
MYSKFGGRIIEQSKGTVYKIALKTNTTLTSIPTMSIPAIISKLQKIFQFQNKYM